METKITLINGDSYIVDKSPKEVIEATTTQMDNIFNGYFQIKEDVWIVSGHILKIEEINNKIEVSEDDDTIVMS